MGIRLRLGALNAALLTIIALAAGGSPREGTASSGRVTTAAVASSIKSGDPLSGSVRWSAEVSGEHSESAIARVVFSIDGVERWSEQSPPYVFKGDDGALDSRRLLVGPHSFGVRAVFADGTVAADSVVANATGGVEQLHGDFDQPGQLIPFDAFEYGGALEPGSPIESQLAWVTSPVRRSRHALRFTVRPGDHFGGSAGERALLRYTDQLSFEGADEYFAWSTLFPEGWAPPKWGLIFELHGDSRFTLAPIRFNAGVNSVMLDMTTGQCTDEWTCSFERRFPVLRTLSKGRWNDFVVHIRFAKSNRGVVEICHHVAGERRWRMAVRLRRAPTLPYFPGQGDPFIYFLWGLYTGPGTATRVLYGDNFTFSTSLQPIERTFRRLPPTCRFTPPPRSD